MTTTADRKTYGIACLVLHQDKEGRPAPCPGYPHAAPPPPPKPAAQFVEIGHE